MIDPSTPDRIVEANPVPTTLVDDDELVDSAVLFSSIVARRDGMNGTQTKEPIETHLTSRPWRRRPAFVLAGVALATVLLVGGTSLILAGGSDPDVTVEPTSSIPPSTTVPVPTTTPTSTLVPTTVASGAVTEPPAISWQHVSGPTLEGGWIAAVTEGGRGLVAVGGSRGADPQTNASGEALHGAGVWVSTDGLEWEAVDDESFSGRDEAGGPESAYMSDVTMGPNGLVAVGFDGRAAVWTSPDGNSWTRVPHDSTVFGSYGAAGAELERVVTASFGLVAVGFTHGEGDQQEVVSWVSPDGETWTRAGTLGSAELLAVDPLGYGDARLDLVAWNDQLIAVGSGNSGEPWTFRPLVWISDDGIRWDVVPDDTGAIEFDPEAAGMAMVSVAASNDRLVAMGWAGSQVGYTGRQRPVTWTSTDGRTWSLDPSVLHTDEPQWGMATIDDTNGQLVMTIADEKRATVFGSADAGESWYPIGSIDGGIGAELAGTGADEIFWTVNDLSTVGDTVIAVGRTLQWSNTDDLGGLCSWGPGDGSAGSCRTDAAIWIGNRNGG